jgi:phage protein D
MAVGAERDGKRVSEVVAHVHYENRDISADIEDYLLELTYTDNLKGDEPDKLTVKLEDSRGLFQGPLYPVKGAAVRFEFGLSTGDLFESGKGFRIDSIDVNGGATGDTVTWVATGQLPSAALHTRRSQAWTDTTLDAVAKAISDRHGLDLVYDCKDKITFSRLDQADKTDLALLTKLAKEYGLACSIKAGKDKPTLVLADPAAAASRPPAFTVRRGDCSSFKFSDRAGLNTKGRYTRWFDPAKKQLVEFETERQGGTEKDGLTEGSIEKLEGRGQQDRAIVREAWRSTPRGSGRGQRPPTGRRR